MGSRRQVEGLLLGSNKNNSCGVAGRKAEWMSVHSGLWLDVVAELCGNSL